MNTEPKDPNENLTLIASAIALLAAMLFAHSTECAADELPQHTLTLMVLESYNASEQEVRDVVGAPLNSPCTEKQQWQSWLDYSPAEYPCTGPIVRFLGGFMAVGQLIEGNAPEYVREKETLLEKFRIELAVFMGPTP